MVVFDEIGVDTYPYCLSYSLPLAPDGLSRAGDPKVIALFRFSRRTFLKMPMN